MEPIILNKNLEIIHILDSFESFIWTERYAGYGDFELYVRASEEILNILQPDYYVCLRETDRVMIIEDRRIQFDVEEGSHIVISGKSLESLLTRRIVWDQTIFSGSFQEGIQGLLNDALINPADTNRTVSNFIFSPSVDPDITGVTSEAQFLRDNLYTAITRSCRSKNLGYKITLNDGQFIFTLLSGKDRSYDQVDNTYVIFSPDIDNILNGEYQSVKSNYKTLTLVAGEGEGTSRVTEVVDMGETNIDRRETYTDARDISQVVDGIPIPEADYKNQLAQRGNTQLSVYQIENNFDAEVDTSITFKYDEDFFLGDVVQIVGEFGIEGMARVTEIVRSSDSNGTNTFPRFSML